MPFCSLVESSGSRVRQVWAGILVLTCCVISGRYFASLKLSVLICKLGLVTAVSSLGGYQD